MRKHYYNKYKEWEQLRIWQKAYIIYEIPLNLVRDITIPIPTDSMWSKTKAILHPITATTMFLCLTQSK